MMDADFAKPRAVYSVSYGQIIREAIVLNVVIFLIVILTRYSTIAAFTAGFLVILYLAFKAIVSPIRAFYLIFGIKLTFDALWFLKMPVPALEQYGLLHLFLIPLVVLIFHGPGLTYHSVRWPVWFALFYLIWVIAVMFFNNFQPTVEIIIRQSGIFLGLLIGVRYIKDRRGFNLFLYLIFISTIIPVLASILQIAASQFNIALFNYKPDTEMLFRPAGLYYDPGTTGMVNIVALLSNAYLLQINFIKSNLRKYHIIFIALNILTIVSGATRSMVVVAFLILLVLFLKYLRQNVRLLAAIVFVGIVFGKPYLDSVMNRSTRDIRRNVEVREILSETDYRTMFTGRVGIWQDILQIFYEGTPAQKLFGTGLSSNAHSTYFFLLLQIGLLGLIFYVVFHLFLILGLWRRVTPGVQKTITILSLMSVLLIGFSLTTVVYTSFQWFTYILVGSNLNQIFYTNSFPSP